MVSIDRCALVLPGKEPGSPTEGLAVLEMDDVLEGGGGRHDKILTDIATKITFGKIKEVALFSEGVLFNGRRWFQDQKSGDVTFHVPDYIKTRIGPIDFARVKAKKDVDRPQRVQRDAHTTEAAWCCRTTLPSDVQWHEVVRRQTSTLERVVIELWLDVKKVTKDALHRPPEEYGVMRQPVVIQCEVDLEAQRQGKCLLTDEEQTRSGDPWRA